MQLPLTYRASGAVVTMISIGWPPTKANMKPAIVCAMMHDRTPSNTAKIKE